MSALNYMNYDRDHVAPATPGQNASDMRANKPMACDHWRISSGQKMMRNAQYRKARPMSGRAVADLMPTAGRKRAPKSIARIDRAGTATFAPLTARDLMGLS